MSTPRSSTVEILERRLVLDAIPVGPEFRVNTLTAQRQSNADVAMDADGNFVVVWESAFQDGWGSGIYAQRYSAAGNAQGEEFRVNVYTTDHQRSPSVAVDADGDFVIAWQSYQDGSDAGIFARRFNAAGVPQGTEFRVNTHTTNGQTGALVAMDADGDFVIRWGSYLQTGPGGYGDLYAQRYNRAGVPQGGEFRINAYTTGREAGDIVMHADGSFIAAWSSDGPNSNPGIYAQRYDAAGAAQGPLITVNTATGFAHLDASVAVDAQGDFVVVWLSFNQDGHGYGVFGQRLDAQGQRVGAEFRANTYTLGHQTFGTVAMAPDGSFVVTWNDQRSDVYGQYYGADGAPSGDEFLVNTHTTGVQRSPRVAMDGQGRFAVAWTDSVQDGDREGIYAQRFEPRPAPAVSASDFLFETAPQRLSFRFNQNVAASLTLDDIEVRALPGGPTVIPSGLTYDPATNTATVTFADVLPDARYRATLIAAGITGPGGALPADHVFDFFFLGADANRDRAVNLTDFNILASNFGQSNRTFSQGDFNYDGTVNLEDFNILAARFGQAVAPSAGVTADGDDDEVTDDALA